MTKANGIIAVIIIAILTVAWIVAEGVRALAPFFQERADILSQIP